MSNETLTQGMTFDDSLEVLRYAEAMAHDEGRPMGLRRDADRLADAMRQNLSVMHRYLTTDYGTTLVFVVWTPIVDNLAADELRNFFPTFALMSTHS